jgi:N-acetylneuraminic acid mutarotase
MIVWGGGNSSDDLDSGGRYDPVLDTWEPVNPTGVPRSSHAAVWTGSRMIVWGGSNTAGALGTGGRYDPANDTWQPTSPIGAPTPRAGLTAVWTGSVMVIWGGGAFTNSGARYDPATDTWAPTTLAGAPTGRAFHTMIWTGNVAILWGGSESNNGSAIATGGRYDPVADTWLPTSTGGGPSGRFSHSSVWTGNAMIVWGGFSGLYENTGSRYDPVTDLWNPVSTVNAPTGRARHTAIWTGNRMIVWGGDHGAPYENTGGVYDPSTDSWTATSLLNAPDARTLHTAVWTGSRMLIFGGSASQVAKVGGRYDPVTDTWTVMTAVGAPHRRYWHTAVWTGSRMIIWGGNDLDSSGDTATGGRYDPVADTWSPVTMTGVPSARAQHSAIWTGAAMIVWGGGPGPAPPGTNSGGRYDPFTDTWLPTALSGAPAGRYRHSAVWTGSRMVVWGGRQTTETPLDTGGVYDPAVDSWQPTSRAAAPAPRDLHTAIWTGNRMIVWGGQNSAYQASGGAYLPDVPTPDVDEDGDGFAACSGDCDDTRADVHPGAIELCDDRDNDCDGLVDGFATTCGVGVCAASGQCVAGTDSCASGTASAEACDALDNDCDGLTDENLPCVAMRIDLMGTTVSWSPVAGATLYDLVWGSMSLLQESGGDYSFSTTGCAGADIASTQIEFTPTPDLGEVFWLVARPQNGAGVGTYDDVPGGAGQTGRRDEGIALSPAACP